MYRVFRYRCIIFRYIILWLFVLTTVKLTTTFYYDFQERYIGTSSSTLLNNIQEINTKSSNESIFSTINTRSSNESIFSTINTIKTLNSSTTTNRPIIEFYRQYVKRKNREQHMYNSNLYSFNRTRYILSVQVHKRVNYLQKFIEMLENVETINETLIIFSHDFIHSDIDTLIKNITFAPVIQIFYPFSPQLYPNEFPGHHPNDCPRDMPRHNDIETSTGRSLTKRCNNAAYPDTYGHYREVQIVQIKHHWWWKLNFIFNFVDVLQNRTDYLVLLLEEDFYLSPDALIFLRKMEDDKERLCPKCLFYTLGNLEKTGEKFHKHASQVFIAHWHTRYNLGMTISHALWTLLVKYAEEFCNFDDYNWDWTLVYLVQQRFNFSVVMVSSVTRIVHLGSCGLHHKKTCSNESNYIRWKETANLYQNNRKYLFPTKSLSIQFENSNLYIFKNPNGGWGDLRDRQLCISFASKHAKELVPIDKNM